MKSLRTDKLYRSPFLWRGEGITVQLYVLFSKDGSTYAMSKEILENYPEYHDIAKEEYFSGQYSVDDNCVTFKIHKESTNLFKMSKGTNLVAQVETSELNDYFGGEYDLVDFGKTWFCEDEDGNPL